jgi:hypothetical protein
MLLTAAVTVALTAGPALAGQCPMLVGQLNAATGNRFDAGAATAKALTAEADSLHKAGKHNESVMKAQEAAKAINLQLQMKK